MNPGLSCRCRCQGYAGMIFSPLISATIEHAVSQIYRFKCQIVYTTARFKLLHSTFVFPEEHIAFVHVHAQIFNAGCDDGISVSLGITACARRCSISSVCKVVDNLKPPPNGPSDNCKAALQKWLDPTTGWDCTRMLCASLSVTSAIGNYGATWSPQVQRR